MLLTESTTHFYASLNIWCHRT